MSPTLSLVVPCYDEEEVLLRLHEEVAAALEATGESWELILVDDGSRDSTPELMRRLAEDDPRVRYVLLARNHGHQLALRAGMDAARGRAVITMDADLQHPPGLVPDMVRRWKEQGHDAILMVRARTAGGGFFKRWTARAFYALFNRISDFPLIPGTADFRLLDRRLLDRLLACGDQRPFYRGLVWWAGGKVETIEYEAPERAGGRTKYSLTRMVLFALDGLFSFSLFPLRLMFLLSAGLLALTVVYGVHVALVHFVYQRTIQGWTSLVGLLLLLFAYVSLSLGVIGEYVGRIYLQTLARPAYVVAESSGSDEEPAALPGEGA